MERGSFGEFTIVYDLARKGLASFLLAKPILAWTNLSREKAPYSTQAIFYSVLRLKYLIKIFTVSWNRETFNVYSS